MGEAPSSVSAPAGVEGNGTGEAETTGSGAPAGRGRRAVRSLGRSLGRWLGREGALALEVVALTSFIVARPVFEAFGDSPETFIARGAGAWDVVLFGLVIHLGPPLLVAGGVAGIALAAGALGLEVRRILQVLVVGALGGVVVWQLLRPLVDWGLWLALPVCALAALAVALARWRWDGTERFLRYAAVGSVVFLVQFLFASPTGSIVGGGLSTGVDDEATAAVEAAVGDDGPPVVLITFDGLPTAALLDGGGRIDAELYPNLADLASDATWYRNHTTVAQITLQAVPAILSGTVPSGSTAPVAGEYPRNLFTMLGGVYDVHGGERITGLCPTSLCPADSRPAPVPRLVNDAAGIWRHTMTDSWGDPELIPAAFGDRVGHFRRWLEAQDFTRGERPDLFAYHMLLPHAGWEYLPDTTRYAASHPPSGLFIGEWGEWGDEVGRQRHVLQTQTTDRLLGELLDRLRAAGTYEDALIVITADHGYAFDEGSPWRGLSEDNADDILWTPLIVKAPGQTEPEIDDRNVNTTDILPTIAAELGVELPYDLDGEPAGEVERDPGDKWVVDWEWGALRAEDGDRVAIDGDAAFRRVLEADWVEGEGPLAAWQRTEHGALVGQPVDELDVGEPEPTVVEVEGLGHWSAVDPEWPPLELRGTGWLPVDTPVAVAVNGVVGAVTPTEETPYGVSVLHALLHPGSMRAGDNEITLYQVEGEPDAPVLRPLEVEAKG